MSGMFNQCSKLTSIQQLDTNLVTNMSNAPSSSTCLVYNFSGGSTMNNECFKMSNLKKKE